MSPIRTACMSVSATVIALSMLVGSASAQKTDAKPPAKGQPYEIGPIVVTARPTRPSAVVELAKILPEVEIAKIRQPFLDKIEAALSGEPF